jgi:hypothetical protein
MYHDDSWHETFEKCRIFFGNQVALSPTPAGRVPGLFKIKKGKSITVIEGIKEKERA